jgi:hypothetical protein
MDMERGILMTTMVWGCCLVVTRRHCLACGKLFVPCPKVKEQAYCSARECQRERKRRWHNKKLDDDPDYRQNRRDTQKRWRETHRDYWRRYRETHPDSAEMNRQRQRERNRLRRVASSQIAKTDALGTESRIIPGRYQLVPLGLGTVAKTDAINVEIRFVPRC